MRQRPGQVRQLSGLPWRALGLRALAFLVAWLLLALPLAVAIFLHSSKSTVIASHDAVVSPTLDGYVTLNLGPYLPNLRHPSGDPVGTQIDLGKTNLSTYDALIRRYAFIGSQPDGQIAKLRLTLTEMAVDSSLSGGLVGLAAPGLWILLGRRRRDQLFRHVTVRRVAITGLAAAIAAVAVTQPWEQPGESVKQQIVWQSVGSALPGIPIPDTAQAIEVQGGLMTSGTRRLAESAFDTYARSVNFYNQAAEDAQSISAQLRQPEDGETVALLLSDRHDNIGMDAVVREISDQGGVTVLFDAGDDTSTGSPWEAFSLDSLAHTFEGLDDRYAIAGNHDHGDFVSDYLGERGFTHLEGEVIDGPEDSRLLGVDDPRSSGLGTWRDEPGLSFAEHRHQLADLACDHELDGDRINTLLVHDATSGDEALERGCVDLVIGGHIHTQLGPTRVVGDNARTGYSYTNGTTGGAAYALAIGSKLRREAQVTLVTYRDGRPVGIQPVTIRTVGDFQVGGYTELDLGETVAGTDNGPLPEESP